MGSYNTSYRVFHISIIIVVVILYALLEYFIIPDYVQDDKKAMASSYTGYGLTICLTLLTAGSMVAEYFDKRADELANKSVLKR